MLCRWSGQFVSASAYAFRRRLTSRCLQRRPTACSSGKGGPLSILPGSTPSNAKLWVRHHSRERQRNARCKPSTNRAPITNLPSWAGMREQLLVRPMAVRQSVHTGWYRDCSDLLSSTEIDHSARQNRRKLETQSPDWDTASGPLSAVARFGQV